MMRLSTLWRIDQTIDEDGRSPIAEAVVAPWHADPGTVRFFRSSANFVYRCLQNNAPCFLRFAAESERPRAEIEAEIALLQWLTGEGIAVARPVPSRQGALVETVETEWGRFHAVVVAALIGEQFDVDQLDLARIQIWGAALGRLHAALRDCPIVIASGRPTLQDRLTEARQWLPLDDPDVIAEFDLLSAFLAALPHDAAHVGLIHGDFELDNLVWQDDAIAALDFDGCMRGWSVADIALAVRDLMDGEIELAEPRMSAFLDGYRQHASLPPDFLDQLPMFTRLGQLLLAASIARSLDLEERDNQPDWLNNLIRRLRLRLAAYEQSLTADNN